MELNVYQDAAKTFAIYPKNNAQLYVLTGLAAEAGEVMGKLAKALRGDLKTNAIWQDERFRASLTQELGDCLWFLAMSAEELDLDLNDIAIANLMKLKSRKERNAIAGDGDNR